jgi:hypothetical protein
MQKMLFTFLWMLAAFMFGGVAFIVVLNIVGMTLGVLGDSLSDPNQKRPALKFLNFLMVYGPPAVALILGICGVLPGTRNEKLSRASRTAVVGSSPPPVIQTHPGLTPPPVISLPQTGAIKVTREELLAPFRRLPCPICGAASGLLNAAMVATARSFLIITHYERRVVVGCPQCIIAASRTANNLTLALGWWGIPWGPIRAFQAISINAKANSAAQTDQATELLSRYVTESYGAIVYGLRQEAGQASAVSSAGK